MSRDGDSDKKRRESQIRGAAIARAYGLLTIGVARRWQLR